MKWGKEEIYAVAECVLFVLGAIFLAIVLIDQSNPLWALWVGLLFAAAGVLLWCRRPLAKLAGKLHQHWQTFVAETKTPANNQPTEEKAETSYELHRPVTEPDELP